jgi:hypothetical protein
MATKKTITQKCIQQAIKDVKKHVFNDIAMQYISENTPPQYCVMRAMENLGTMHPDSDYLDETIALLLIAKVKYEKLQAP